MKSLKLRVRKTMFVFIAATGVFVLLFAQWRTHSQALMSAGAENLTTPLVGLTTAQRADFNAGLAEFQAVETIAEGLGPVFNGKSCAECHAVPSVGGSEPNLGVARETRIGRLFNGVFDPLDGSANLYDTANPATVLEFERGSPSRGKCAGIDCSVLGGTSRGRYRQGIRCAEQAAPGWTLVAGAGPQIRANQKRIVGFALKSRLPSMYQSREAVDAGGLMSYGADQAESYRRAATYVDKILKGAKPADLPVEQPTKFELVINLKTAKALNLTIPQSVLYQADKVIK